MCLDLLGRADSNAEAHRMKYCLVSRLLSTVPANDASGGCTCHGKQEWDVAWLGLELAQRRAAHR